MKKTFLKILYWFVSKIKTLVLDMQLQEVKILHGKYEDRLKKKDNIYTTIKSFYGDDDVFWKWANSLVSSDEFKYLLFCLRENAIRDLVHCADNSKLLEKNGRIQMLEIMDAYLRKGIQEYEAQVQRTKENS